MFNTGRLGQQSRSLAMAFCVLLAFQVGSLNALAQQTTVEDVLRQSSTSTAEQTEIAAASPGDRTLNLFDLIVSGGMLMIPIGFLSVVVITLVIERSLALRRSRVMPSGLIKGLSALAAVPGAMDPRKAFRLCQEYPSPTSEVVQAMLLKIGRPQAEVETAVSEATKREVARLYSKVRWLNLAAAVSPLIGLLGTVWGLIQAFFLTTQLDATQNKADFLAEGIYVALVTTLGGLTVAIPAAIFAHYFEGRIQDLAHRIEELVFNLSPQIERFEGRMRVSPQTLSGQEITGDDEATSPAVSAESKGVAVN